MVVMVISWFVCIRGRKNKRAAGIRIPAASVPSQCDLSIYVSDSPSRWGGRFVVKYLDAHPTAAITALFANMAGMTYDCHENDDE